MADSFYRLPITQDYTTRGCHVSINAGSNSNYVDIFVNNTTTGICRHGQYVFSPVKKPEDWYSEEDMRHIHNMINEFLDACGDDSEWNFTNQILS